MSESFTLRDPRALERVRDLFDQAPFLAHLGIRLVGLGPGWAETELPVRRELFQSNGFVHAGAIATLADHTAGAAAGTLAAADQHVLAVELKLNLLRPGVGDRLSCRAEILRAGRRLVSAEARVRAHQAGQEKLVATFSSTLAFASDDGRA